MAYLKKGAPPDVIEALQRVEAQADECWRTLQLLQQSSNVALWALLTVPDIDLIVSTKTPPLSSSLS